MKLAQFLLMLAIAGVTAPTAVAEQQNVAMERGQKARPDPDPVASTERTLGVCKPIENKLESRSSAVNAMSPVSVALDYLDSFEHKKLDQQANFLSIFNTAKMTLLQAPTHGELKLGQNSGAYYSSDYTYEGLDSATVLVEVGGYKVKVFYRFVLMQDVPGSTDEGKATDQKDICPNGYRWKISTTLDTNGNITVNSVEHELNQMGQARNSC